VFVRTRDSASEVAEKVNAWGYRAEAIHGAIGQNQREKTINGLKKNRFDVLVATDVAARGLDVDRFSHVVNYDIPYDSESYVHRIGRTGRAGREGEAVLFVTHRENRLLKTIERHTKQKIERAQIPNNDVVLQQRVERFKQQVAEQATTAPSAMIQGVVEQCCHDLEIEPEQLAAVLINMLHRDHPLNPADEMKTVKAPREGGRERGSLAVDEAPIATQATPLPDYPDVEMERFRIEVGHKSGVKPRDIVGAIANEAGIESTFIGDIILRNEFSTVDLPAGMPRELFTQMKKIRVRGVPIRITRFGKDAPDTAAKGTADKGKSKPRSKAGKGGERKFADNKRSFKSGGKSGGKGKPGAGKSKPKAGRK
jgi:ATP-dependent RNA helicase DeaD